MPSDKSDLGTVADLARQLTDLHLVSEAEMRRCVSELPGNANTADLIRLLGQRDFLTSFQTIRIEKGNADSLIVGGCKLMYLNAEGSFARLYRAARLDNGQMIGIKILRERWTKDHDSIQMFHREGEQGKRLKHPNIVPIFEVGTSGKHHFITMEFVEGGNLKDFLKIRGHLAPVEALQYTLHITRALEAALALGLTHRDMKTTNVLLTTHGVAKLIDFGLADDSGNTRESNADLAQALEYSTLEKHTGAPKNDPRSDLFFLGTILYELLTGEPPYPRTKSREERRDFSRYRDIPSVSSLDPSLPPTVTAIVGRLLKINPGQRYQSPTAVIRDLEVALKELGKPEPVAPEKSALGETDRVLICVEHRQNRQDVLREYFSKHGYRVVLLGDPERALARLKTVTPFGVLFFGDAIGDQVAKVFHQALQQTKQQPVAVVAVQEAASKAIPLPTGEDAVRGVVLPPPVNTRSLRLAVEGVHKQLAPKAK